MFFSLLVLQYHLLLFGLVLMALQIRIRRMKASALGRKQLTCEVRKESSTLLSTLHNPTVHLKGRVSIHCQQAYEPLITNEAGPHQEIALVSRSYIHVKGLPFFQQLCSG